MSSVLVILNYNDATTTLKLVEQVRTYKCPDFVVVVDNMSSDDSYEILKECIEKHNDQTDIGVTSNEKNEEKLSKNICVIQAPENGGYAKGNNFGIRYAIKEYDPEVIFVANPDVSVNENTFISLYETIKENSEYGVIAPIVNQGANAWNLPGFVGMIESLFMVWFTIDKKNIKKRLMKSERDLEAVGVVEGSFFGISREAYETIDGLDENTFLYVEENILSKRLKNHGYKVGVLTKERYDHFHSVSIKKRYKSRKAKAFHNFYPSMTYYNKAYLGTGAIRNSIFAVAYGIAYVERIVYDIVMTLRRHT